MEDFNSLKLPELLLRSLVDMQFHKPTPIQAQTIPLALEGKDILGSAQTGTGKTGAYGIPLVYHLLNNPSNSALVLTPTRELALQVSEILKQLLGKKINIQTTLLIGGAPMFKQLNQLKKKPSLIVGTPGRINDHLKRGTLKLNNTNFIVFDETDRMLDMGFEIQLREIAKFLPETRQTLMFSATISSNIAKIAQSYLKDPVRVTVGSTTSPVENITQEILRSSESDKYNMLRAQLDKTTGSSIVFVKTKMGTEKLASRLRGNGYSADAIHGDLRQRSRENVIKAFRDRKNNVLIATDVAARGLDIPHIECVVNYDLPQSPEDYLHRIGRTARNGSNGVAVSLITPQDNVKWGRICRLMKIPTGKNDNEPRNYDDRPPRENSGERRRPKSKFSNSGDRSARFGVDRQPSRSNNASDRPARSGDRSARFGVDRQPSRSNSASDRPPRSGDRPFSRSGDRPARPHFSERPNRVNADERPSRSNSYKGSNKFSKAPRGNNGNTKNKSNAGGGKFKFGHQQTKRARSSSSPRNIA